MEDFISYFIPDIQIEDTVMPFRTVATDLKSGECVLFKEGSLRRSILASSAVPGAIPPVEIEGRQLSDGGIVCNVPVTHVLAEGARGVIAIAVVRDITLGSSLETAVDIYVRAGEIQGFHLERHDLKNAHILIRPRLGDVHWTDFSESTRLIALGEEAVREKLPEVKRMVKSLAPWSPIKGVKGLAQRFFVRRPLKNG